MNEASRPNAYERRTIELGREIFERAAAAQPKVWKRAYWDELLTNFSMRDEDLKVRLFRFVDILPSLQGDADIARHLKEYLDPQACNLPGPLRLAVSFNDPHSWLARTTAAAVRTAAYNMATRFVSGSTADEAIDTIAGLRKREMAFTIDVLGEATTSDAQADHYADVYVGLVESLCPAARNWEEVPLIDRDASGRMSRVNVSVKLSALDPHFQSIDPARANETVGRRLRPILRAAQKHGAFINVDMESFAVRDRTLQIFKSILAENEFRDYPHIGIVVQAYLQDAENDLRGLLEWVGRRGSPIAIRLVKGAYWDHETILAAQFNTRAPVWLHKWESDACFERLTKIMIEHHDRIRPAFASHNVRSLAHVMACADHYGLSAADYEIQMLFGMGDPLKQAMVDMRRCLRVYCPYGELLPGMAYLIRRLLENTSNDSFLRQGFSERRSHDRLLTDPAVARPPSTPPAKPHYQDTDKEPPMRFRNMTVRSFLDDKSREQMAGAIQYVRGELGRSYPLRIKGTDVDVPERVDSTNPSRPAEIIGRVCQASSSHVDRAVAAAYKAFDDWRRLPAARRAQILFNAADRIEQQRSEMAAWIILESGKPWREADADVCEAVDYIRYYAERIEIMDNRPRRRDLPGEENMISYEPRGVCVVIGPFNFPLALPAGMVCAALAMGNTVVFKPSSAAPVVGSQFVRILEQAGVPAGAVNCLPGSGEAIGANLVNHPEVAVVAFTGSRAVGVELIESAAVVRPGQRHIKKVIADMGGSNATIVDTDAEIDDAVAGVLASAFAYAGQRCSACSRAIVVEGVADAFSQKLVEATKGLLIGEADKPATQIGPLINAQAMAAVQATVDAVRSDCRVLLEMDTSHVDSGGHFLGPVILDAVQPNAVVAQEEVFGPVLSIIRAKTFEDAMDIANNTPYALTGGVYSRSPAHLDLARREFRVGNLYLNRKITGSRVDIQPFGGFNMSGTGNGKVGGPDYLLQFATARCITENTLRHGFAPTDASEAKATA